MDVVFQYPVRMIANALGIAPPSMIDRARDHAIRQVEAGVDFLVAQGTEAAGHCG